MSAVVGESLPIRSSDSLQRDRIGEKFGFASHIFRCSWHADGRPYSVVVKIWNTASPAGIGEVLFYKELGEPGLRTPACYFAGLDGENQAAVLVLEDLQDVTQGDELLPITRNQSGAIAAQLARMHAKWMMCDPIERQSWLVDISVWEPGEDWLHSRRALFRERFGRSLGTQGEALLDGIESVPQLVNDRLSNARGTLLHGDLHLDNIVFESGTQPVFLDWARPAWGPQAINVADLMFGMVPLELVDSAVDAYLNEFELQSPGALNIETFEHQLGCALLRKFVARTCGIARWQPTEPRALEIIESGLRHTAEFVEFLTGTERDLLSILD